MESKNPKMYGLMSCVRENSPPLDLEGSKYMGPISQDEMPSLPSLPSSEHNQPLDTDTQKRKKFRILRNIRQIFRRRTADTSIGIVRSDSFQNTLSTCRSNTLNSFGRSETVDSGFPTSTFPRGSYLDKDQAQHQYHHPHQGATSNFRNSRNLDNEMIDYQRSLSESRLLDGQNNRECVSQSHDSVFSESPAASVLISNGLKAELVDVLRKRRNKQSASERDLQNSSSQSIDRIQVQNEMPSMQINEMNVFHDEKLKPFNYSIGPTGSVSSMGSINKYTDTTEYEDTTDNHTRLDHSAARHKMAIKPKRKGPTKPRRSIVQNENLASVNEDEPDHKEQSINEKSFNIKLRPKPTTPTSLPIPEVVNQTVTLFKKDESLTPINKSVSSVVTPMNKTISPVVTPASSPVKPIDSSPTLPKLLDSIIPEKVIVNTVKTQPIPVPKPRTGAAARQRLLPEDIPNDEKPTKESPSSVESREIQLKSAMKSNIQQSNITAVTPTQESVSITPIKFSPPKPLPRYKSEDHLLRKSEDLSNFVSIASFTRSVLKPIEKSKSFRNLEKQTVDDVRSSKQMPSLPNLNGIDSIDKKFSLQQSNDSTSQESIDTKITIKSDNKSGSENQINPRRSIILNPSYYPVELKQDKKIIHISNEQNKIYKSTSSVSLSNEKIHTTTVNLSSSPVASSPVNHCEIKKDEQPKVDYEPMMVKPSILKKQISQEIEKVPEFMKIQLNKVTDVKRESNVVVMKRNQNVEETIEIPQRRRKFSNENIEISEIDHQNSKESSSKASSPIQQSPHQSPVMRKDTVKSNDVVQPDSKNDISNQKVDESDVVLRKKPPVAQRKPGDDSTPELMKVFARLSMKIRDGSMDDESDDVKTEPIGLKSKPGKSGGLDSDKENQSSSEEKLDLVSNNEKNNQLNNKAMEAEVYPKEQIKKSSTMPKLFNSVTLNGNGINFRNSNSFVEIKRNIFTANNAKTKTENVTNNNEKISKNSVEPNNNLKVATQSLIDSESKVNMNDINQNRRTISVIPTHNDNESDKEFKEYSILERRAEWEKRAKETFQKYNQ